MQLHTENRDVLGQGDDIVAAFQIEDSAVRGRVARLGEGTIDAIIHRHDYPRWAAILLGEAVTLAVLASASLKFNGKVTVQAQGDGPVSLLVAESRSDGGVRGYLRLDRDRWNKLDRINKGQRPHIPQVFGRGILALMLTPDDPDGEPYQGLVPMDGATLSDCAEAYFAMSEQIPTRIRLAVAEISTLGGDKHWRAGGALIQQVAPDDARGDTEEEWDNARALFDTVTDLELADPDLSSGALLYRLFHENGVRLETPKPLQDQCTCSEERLTVTLGALSKEEAASLADENGLIDAGCQFCSRTYRIPAASLSRSGS
jgi:molecular chaperone Hsp33